MTSILPYDCIRDMLEFLRDDKKTLYDCLYVNRTWCQLTIPLLWTRPFEKENGNKSHLVIDTLITCLNEEENQRLRAELNDLPETKPALFKYAIYINGFDYQNFENAIKKWTKLRCNEINVNMHVFLFQIIGNLIFSRSKNLKILNLNHDDKCHDDEKSLEYTIFQKILTFNNVEKVLLNLEKLELKYFGWEYDIDGSFGDKISRFFIQLSNYSHNIQELIIDIFFDSTNTFKVSESLTKLIESQRNLHLLQVNEYIGYSFIHSIKSQANSLKFLRILELSNFHTLLPILHECVKLETLEFTEYFEVEKLGEFVNPNLSLPQIHIKNLLAYQIDMERNPQNFEDAMAILINLSRHKLESLTMEYVTYRTISFLKSHCPNNLTHLSLKISTFALFKLYELFPLLRSLETLILIESGRYEDSLSQESTNQLSQLARTIPPSLKCLGISFLIDLYGYKKFYEELSVPIQELDVYISLNDDHLKEIVSYAEKNRNLKRVGIMRFKSSLKDGHISMELYQRSKALIPFVGETKKIKHFVNK
ncbi:20725_t:CDS:1 [Funneliformis geosporum]|uniref:11642_t:CDS:1 n=1 Tax=Funneliformis geosporum TaxID=1117311 RepID=A0A9W4SF44_9GLOM|nr:20725_t:CDS:1 [Funneliformis geosporum]CAI2167174.1 11642_t:CDS:1 [Funneliformis geosporum]